MNLKNRKMKKHVKTKKQVKNVFAVVQKAEDDEDLREILNKTDFNKYELDAYLNELG